MSCCLSLTLRFVLLLFVFVFFAFSEAAALRPIVLRSSIYMRPDSHTQLNTLQLSASFFVFVSSFFCFFGDVAFSEFFFTITVFSLYGEYVVLFFLPDGVFLPCENGLDF